MLTSATVFHHRQRFDDRASSTVEPTQGYHWTTSHHRTNLAALESLLQDQLEHPSTVSSFRKAKRVRQWIRAVLQDAEMSSANFFPRPRWQSIASWFATLTSQWTHDASLAGVRLNVATCVDPDAKLWIDSDFVSIVLDHFVSNAILNSQPSEGVQVSIRASKDEEPWLSIEVRDQSNDEVDKLRDDVTWSKSTIRRPYLPPVLGHGLGLRVAVRYAAIMNGYVDFSSLPGQGTAFSLHLPAGGIYAWLTRTQRRHSKHIDFADCGRENDLQVFDVTTRNHVPIDLVLKELDHLYGQAEWQQIDASRILIIPTGDGLKSNGIDGDGQSPELSLSQLLPALSSCPFVSDVEVRNLGSLDILLSAIERGVETARRGLRSHAFDLDERIVTSARPTISEPNLLQTSGRIASPPAVPISRATNRHVPMEKHSERKSLLRLDRPHLPPPFPKLRFRELESLQFERVNSSHR